MRDPPLNTSNNRSKHLYQSDHVVISISVFCLSNIDRRIVFVLIAVLFINFVLFSAFVHVAVGFAWIVTYHQGKRSIIHWDLFISEILVITWPSSVWTKEMVSRETLWYRCDTLSRAFQAFFLKSKCNSALLSKLGFPADLYDKVAVSSARSLLVWLLRMRQLRCISHGVQVFIMTVEPLIIQ